MVLGIMKEDEREKRGRDPLVVKRVVLVMGGIITLL